MANRSCRLRRACTLALLAAVVSQTSGDEAEACINEVEVRVDPRVAVLKRAEDLASGGKPLEAARTVLIAEPRVRAKKVGQDGVTDRALVVMARATVRTGGAAYAEKGDDPSLEKRGDALRWAAGVFEDLRRKKGDPVALTDLGEALTRLPDRRAEARRILTDLERQDLMASGYGYAALAELRAGEAEDAPAYVRAPLMAMVRYERELALLRCRDMSKDPAACPSGP